MFVYFYGNLQGLEQNPSEKAQQIVRLAQKYHTYLSLFPLMFDGDGNIVNLPEEGGLFDQDFITMKIVLAMKSAYVEYINSKLK